jgi:hypothetical protein
VFSFAGSHHWPRVYLLWEKAYLRPFFTLKLLAFIVESEKYFVWLSPILCELSFLSFFFCNSQVWIQGLHLEPLYQPFFVMVFFS